MEFLKDKNILLGLGLVAAAYFLAKKSKKEGNEVVAVGKVVGGEVSKPKVLIKPAAPAKPSAFSGYNGAYADGFS